MFCFKSKKDTVKALNDCHKGDYTILNLYNYSTDCKVVDVYDGDSIEVIFDYTDKQRLEVKVRMYGYDAPDIKRPKNEENKEEMKRLAEDIRDKLREQILNTVCTITFKGWDNYGRVKGVIIKDGLCINQWMLDNSYGTLVDNEKL